MSHSLHLYDFSQYELFHAPLKLSVYEQALVTGFAFVRPFCKDDLQWSTAEVLAFAVARFGYCSLGRTIFLVRTAGHCGTGLTSRDITSCEFRRPLAPEPTCQVWAPVPIGVLSRKLWTNMISFEPRPTVTRPPFHFKIPGYRVIMPSLNQFKPQVTVMGLGERCGTEPNRMQFSPSR